MENGIYDNYILGDNLEYGTPGTCLVGMVDGGLFI
jgi:hypothetical protein